MPAAGNEVELLERRTPQRAFLRLALASLAEHLAQTRHDDPWDDTPALMLLRVCAAEARRLGLGRQQYMDLLHGFLDRQPGLEISLPPGSWERPKRTRRDLLVSLALVEYYRLTAPAPP